MPLERASGFSILMQRRHGGRKDLSSSALRNAEWRASLNLVLVRTGMLLREICQIEDGFRVPCAFYILFSPFLSMVRSQGGTTINLCKIIRETAIRLASLCLSVLTHARLHTFKTGSA